jgi:hypothetical protein
MESFDVGDKVELIDATGQLQSGTGEQPIKVPVGTVMEIERIATNNNSVIGWVCRWVDMDDFDRRGVFLQSALRKCDPEATISIVG